MENQQQQSTPLCRAGCGFFGSSTTDGLCSKCFKDSIKKSQDTGRASPNSIASSADKFPDLKTTFETAIANAKSNIEGDMLKLGSPSLSSSSSSASLAVETALVDTSTSGPEPSTSGPETNTSMKSKPNRCQVCKKRVGLTGFPCRCGGLYCGEHRYDTTHDCQFDYKTIEREELRKNNPAIMAEKIQKI